MSTTLTILCRFYCIDFIKGKAYSAILISITVNYYQKYLLINHNTLKKQKWLIRCALNSLVCFCWRFLEVLSVILRLLTLSVSDVSSRLERVEEWTLLRAPQIIYKHFSASLHSLVDNPLIKISWHFSLALDGGTVLFSHYLSVQWLIVPWWRLTIS